MNTLIIVRTGQRCHFGNISIGALFWHGNDFWVRTDRYAASRFGVNGKQDACAFASSDPNSAADGFGRSMNDAQSDLTMLRSGSNWVSSVFGSNCYGLEVEDVEFTQAQVTDHSEQAPDANRMQRLTKALAQALLGLYELHEPEGQFQPSHFKRVLLPGIRALAQYWGIEYLPAVYRIERFREMAYPKPDVDDVALLRKP